MSTKKAVRRVAIVGAGVIGASWSALFLAKGLQVIVSDPAPNAETSVKEFVRKAWPALERLGLRDDSSRDRLRNAASMGAALADADFVQESSPEVLAAKVELLGEIDALTRPDVVVASSTSGFMMSDMAVAAACGASEPGSPETPRSPLN